MPIRNSRTVAFKTTKHSMTPRSVSMNADSGEKTWLTPPHIIEALGPFDLDPCCPPVMPWRTATRMVCRPDDGLAVDWRGSRVWCNPPYGRDAVPFMRKLAANRAEGGGGYRPHLRPHRYFGVARPHLSVRRRRPVPSRTPPLLPRQSRWSGCARPNRHRAVCARRVFGRRLRPSALVRP